MCQNQILDILETFQKMGIMYIKIKPDIQYDNFGNVIGLCIVASHFGFLHCYSEEAIIKTIDEWKRNVNSLILGDLTLTVKKFNIVRQK